MNLKRLIKIEDSKVLFDKEGNPSWYFAEDNSSLYDFDGNPIGYIFEETLFTYKGDHIGFYKDGWLIDKTGMLLFFTPEAKNGPILPATRMSRAKAAKRIPCIVQVRKIRQTVPIIVKSWSNLNIKDLIK